MRINPLVEKLQSGETISYRPHGNSMTGRVSSGQLCTVAPATLEDVAVGDVVLCKVKGRVFLHLVKAIGDDRRLLISNNHGHVNGWTRTVYGKLIEVAN